MVHGDLFPGFSRRRRQFPRDGPGIKDEATLGELYVSW